MLFNASLVVVAGHPALPLAACRPSTSAATPHTVAATPIGTCTQ
jgi:hypothetical protein